MPEKLPSQEVKQVLTELIKNKEVTVEVKTEEFHQIISVVNDFVKEITAGENSIQLKVKK